MIIYSNKLSKHGRATKKNMVNLVKICVENITFIKGQPPCTGRIM